MAEYVHQELNEEIRSIGGYYMVVEEGILNHNGREVLYIVKVAEVESCCGTGGCGYILVPGYVISWKNKRNDAGLAISVVEPIQEVDTQGDIKKVLEEKYPHFSMIDFG